MVESRQLEHLELRGLRVVRKVLGHLDAFQRCGHAIQLVDVVLEPLASISIHARCTRLNQVLSDAGYSLFAQRTLNIVFVFLGSAEHWIRIIDDQ